VEQYSESGYELNLWRPTQNHSSLLSNASHNIKGPGTHDRSRLHVTTCFDPPDGTLKQWKHDTLSHKHTHSCHIKSPPLRSPLPLSLCELSFLLSYHVQTFNLTQVMDTTSKLPVSARVISQLCSLSFQTMAPSFCLWELNSKANTYYERWRE
jgi:hypothetical protein